MIKYLHPHHLLCINFFIGKGYSNEFVINMKKQIKLLEEENPIVCFTKKMDKICEYCPNYLNNECMDIIKVDKYDKNVINYLGLGDKEYHYLDLINLTIDRIIRKYPIDNICSDCCYNNICKKI